MTAKDSTSESTIETKTATSLLVTDTVVQVGRIQTWMKQTESRKPRGLTGVVAVVDVDVIKVGQDVRCKPEHDNSPCTQVGRNFGQIGNLGRCVW